MLALPPTPRFISLAFANFVRDADSDFEGYLCGRYGDCLDRTVPKDNALYHKGCYPQHDEAA